MYGALILFEDEFIHIVAISFSALILTELVMVALTIRTWHRLMVLAEVFSLLLYLVSLIVFHEYFGEYCTVLFSRTERQLDRDIVSTYLQTGSSSGRTTLRGRCP